jgi:signal transduction histidine kinase
MTRRLATRDLALAAGLAGLAQLDIWTSVGVEAPPQALTAVAAAVATLSLAWRRRAPVGSVLVSMSALVLLALFGRVDGNWVLPVLLLAMFSVARYAPTRGAALAASVALVFNAIANVREDNRNIGEYLGNFLFIAIAMIGVPWTAGYALRRRQGQSAGQARAAVDEERLRIARELHDVVGHALGVIVVQAGAERMTLPSTAPESARETLAAIEQTARAALGEMRRLVEVLRRDDDDVALAPQPSLSAVQTLVENVRAAGLPVELYVEGEPVPLPAGVDLSAYRIVQEALTNALRHADAAPTCVTVRYLQEVVEVDVVDQGLGVPAAHSGGHGLVGMRERVSLYGGTLATGAQPGGGYAVRVRLPRDGSRL